VSKIPHKSNAPYSLGKLETAFIHTLRDFPTRSKTLTHEPSSTPRLGSMTKVLLGETLA
jgi:hypothetical protein